MIEFQESCTIEEILNIHKLIYSAEFPISSYRSKLEKKKSMINVGFYLDGIMVGYCIVIDFKAEKRFHAWVGGTVPEYQGQGIFSQFYDWLLNTAKKRDYLYISGNTDNYKPNMLRLLIKKGFDIIGTEHTPHGDGRKILLRYSVHKPVKLRLSVTNVCNLNCFFCHHDGVIINDMVHLTIPEIERILIQAKKICVEEITVTGGEPATYFSAIEYILKYCNGWDHPPKIKIATNGVLWTKERVERLKGYLGEVSFNISLHSIHEQLFQKIYGCQMPKDIYLQLFSWLNENSIAFRINATILRGINDSPQNFFDLFHFMLKHEIHSVHFMELLLTKEQTTLFPYYCTRDEITRNLLMGIEGRYQYELMEETPKKTVYKISDRTQSIQATIYRLSCRVGCAYCFQENDITIGADGKGHPCYIDPDVCCGNAVDSLLKTMDQCKAYVEQQPLNKSMQRLYWGN